MLLSFTRDTITKYFKHFPSRKGSFAFSKNFFAGMEFCVCDNVLSRQIFLLIYCCQLAYVFNFTMNFNVFIVNVWLNLPLRELAWMAPTFSSELATIRKNTHRLVFKNLGKYLHGCRQVVEWMITVNTKRKRIWRASTYSQASHRRRFDPWLRTL